MAHPSPGRSYADGGIDLALPQANFTNLSAWYGDASLPKPISFDVDGTNLGMEIIPLGAYKRPLSPPYAVIFLLDEFNFKVQIATSRHRPTDPVEVKHFGVVSGGLEVFIEPEDRPEKIRSLEWSDMNGVVTGLYQHIGDVQCWPSRIYLFDRESPKTGAYVIGSGNIVSAEAS